MLHREKSQGFWLLKYFKKFLLKVLKMFFAMLGSIFNI